MENKLGKFSWSKFFLLLVAIISIWHIFFIRLNDENKTAVINSDGAGYYAYLPAAFIYHDLTFNFAETTSPTYKCAPGCDVHLFGNRTLEGKRINKYFIGTSILQLPFFLVALTASKIFGSPTDGYSFPFQLFIALAGLFYLLAGLFCIWKLLSKMNFSDKIIAIVLFILFFGTNLYHYALEEPSMSHIYSFAIISFFLLTVFRLSENFSRKQLILLVFSLTIIILIRPVNGIIIFLLPFFISNRKEFFQKIISDKTSLFISIGIFLGLLFLQSLIWKITVGHWIADSYKGESLNIFHPHIPTILFSWQKGLFIYTPILLMSLIGLFFIRPQSRSLILFGFLFVNSWIISSWHDLSYGGSLGMRPFIDTYAVFAILFAFFLQAIKNKIAMISTALAIAFFVFLNLFQHYQYHFSILPYNEMTWNKYKRIFLRSEKVFIGIFSPGNDSVGYLPKGAKLINSYKRNFDNDTAFTNRTGIISGAKYFSAPNSAQLDYKCNLSPDLFVKIYDAVPENNFEKTLVKVSAKIWTDNDASDAKMVIAFKNKDSTFQWNGFYIVHRVDKINSWCDYSYVVPLPYPKNKDEIVSVYVLKEDNSLVFVDDLELSFWKKP